MLSSVSWVAVTCCLCLSLFVRTGKWAGLHAYAAPINVHITTQNYTISNDLSALQILHSCVHANNGEMRRLMGVVSLALDRNIMSRAMCWKLIIYWFRMPEMLPRTWRMLTISTNVRRMTFLCTSSNIYTSQTAWLGHRFQSTLNICGTMWQYHNKKLWWVANAPNAFKVNDMLSVSVPVLDSAEASVYQYLCRTLSLGLWSRIFWATWDSQD